MSAANTDDTVSAANTDNTVSAANTDDTVSAADITVLKGSPTAAELAALVAVLAGLRGASAAAEPGERDLWGHPVDMLRYPVTSWQRVTLLERTHMRR